MIKKLIGGFALVALSVASAATSYKVTFYEPVTINGAKLKAGEYKVEAQGSTAIIKQGKTVAETPVKVENEEQKFATNSVRMVGGQVTEIRVGGTHTRLVFDKTGDATN